MPTYAQIDIDRTKCTTPFDCKKCLQVCPQAVFGVHAVKVARFVETDKKTPGTYVLTASRRDKCVLCNDCLKVCPVDAIKISVPEAV